MAVSARPVASHLRALALVCAVLACGVYTAGLSLARRDLTLEGDSLYLARLVQIGVLLGCAVLFRNHLPNVRAMLIVGAGSLGLCTFFSFCLMPADVGAAPPIVAVCTAVTSGIANALFMMLPLHLFSTYDFRMGCTAALAAYLVREVLFAWTSAWGDSAIAVGQVALRVVGALLLFIAVAAKGRGSLGAGEYGLQQGFPLADRTGERPVAFLVNDTDWVFQLIAALLFPFIFGFMSQLLSGGVLSDGLHDMSSEAMAVVALSVFMAFVAARRGSLGFMHLFVPVTLLYAFGLMLLPMLWGFTNGPASACLKAACVLYEAALWALLTRKAHDDPRHTYLYLGVFLAVANATYGRLCEPVLLGNALVDKDLVSSVCLVFLFALVMLCLLLFVLQRSIGAARDGKSGAMPGQGEMPDGSFTVSVDALCEQCHLTPREREVLLEVLHGYTMANVAHRLGISPETVRTHMRSVYQKTGTDNKQALIRHVDTRSKMRGKFS